MNSIASQIQVAMGDDFLMAFSQLPKGIQKKTRVFIDKFRKDPTGSNLNYEKINGASDPNLRSLRVDLDYRAIILKPERGNIYILLWVDKHDSAYDWASGRVCSINPNTGTIQVLPVQTGEEAPLPPEEVPISPPETAEQAPGTFDPFTNAEILELGIPSQFLANIREVTSDQQLDDLESDLPPDAFEALYYLALGSSLEETKRELGIEKPEEVDTSDFDTALNRESSKRKFVLISDAEEMDKILSYPLDRWRIFLHPSQKRIVKMNAKGPIRVLGGAGTGKTVVAIHRAKWLAENICTQGEKILFTTFTKNLAADIENNLRKLCPHETLKKIEVINLDAWASRLLASKGIKSSRVDFPGTRTRELWQEALTATPAGCSLSAEDLENEWKYVVQAQGIRSESGYIRASRVGMGKPLSRGNRKAIWPVFEEYISLLKERGVCEPIDALRMARELIEEQKLVLDYRSVVVDEAQDLSAEAFRLANAIVPAIRAEQGNNLFIAGDAHQRLYGHKIVLSHCGINIVGRSRKLRINYRTSEETRNWATAILKSCVIDDLDGGIDDQKGYRSLFHGEVPLIEPCADSEEQTKVILEHINNLLSQGAPTAAICVVANTNALVQTLSDGISAAGLNTLIISNQSGDDSSREGIRLATMHRVKGIEFDHVILAHMEKQNWRKRMISGPSSGKLELTIADRCLIYVAATRARKSVLVTSAGEMLEEITPR